MTEKKKRGRPPGSGKKKPEIRYVDPVTTEVSVALHNAEHPEQFTETYTVPYPSDWDKMTKSEKLAYFTEHRK